MINSRFKAISRLTLLLIITFKLSSSTSIKEKLKSGLINVNPISSIKEMNVLRIEGIIEAIKTGLTDMDWLEEILAEWLEYEKKYCDDCDDKTKERERCAMFIKSCRDMWKHNMKKSTYEKGKNQFMCHSYDEIRAKRCGLKKPDRKGKNETLDKTTDLKRDASNMNPPESIDWRDVGIMSPVKDQGDCGACWAFSTCCVLESYAMKAMKAQNKSVNNMDLSEQCLMDCSGEYGNEGCNGGFMNDAFGYVKHNGITEEGQYKYMNKDGECFYPSSSIKKCDQISCDGYSEIREGDEEALKQAIFFKGPVCGAIHVTPNLLKYKRGIFMDPNCDANQVNHAIVIVGYGSENGIEYWIVRNSWGSFWGEDGYFRIKRGSNHCGIASLCSYPIVPNCPDTHKVPWILRKRLRYGSNSDSEDKKCECKCD